MNVSRILPAVGALAASIAATEVQNCRPFIDKALDELPADLKSGDPTHALLATAKEAGSAMLAAGFQNISLLGLLGAAWDALSASGDTVTNPPQVAPAPQPAGQEQTPAPAAS